MLAAAAAAAMLIDRDPRRRCVWMLLALTLTAVILIGHIADTAQFRSLTTTAAIRRALRGGPLTVRLLALLFVRSPAAFPAARGGRAALQGADRGRRYDHEPARAPVPGDRRRLLSRSRGMVMRERRTAAAREDVARPLSIALAVFLVLYALQSLYSKDFDTALEQIVFFFVPFALLFGLLREVRWSRELVLGCLGVLVALAVVFARSASGSTSAASCSGTRR